MIYRLLAQKQQAFLAVKQAANAFDAKPEERNALLLIEQVAALQKALQEELQAGSAQAIGLNAQQRTLDRLQKQLRHVSSKNQDKANQYRAFVQSDVRKLARRIAHQFVDVLKKECSDYKDLIGQQKQTHRLAMDITHDLDRLLSVFEKPLVQAELPYLEQVEKFIKILGSTTLESKMKRYYFQVKTHDARCFIGRIAILITLLLATLGIALAGIAINDHLRHRPLLQFFRRPKSGAYTNMLFDREQSLTAACAMARCS